jgi:uncharacterized protein (DUF3820 family)
MIKKPSPNRRIESGWVKSCFEREQASISQDELYSTLQPGEQIYEVIHGRSKEPMGQLVGTHSQLIKSKQVPKGCYLRKVKHGRKVHYRHLKTMVRMPFGKYQGRMISGIKDKAYLLWVVRNVDNLSEHLMDALTYQISVLEN